MGQRNLWSRNRQENRSVALAIIIFFWKWVLLFAIRIRILRGCRQNCGLQVHIRPAGRPAVRSCVRRAFDAKSLAATESSDPESVSPSTPLTQRRRTSLMEAQPTNISNSEDCLLASVIYSVGIGFDCRMYILTEAST